MLSRREILAAGAWLYSGCLAAHARIPEATEAAILAGFPLYEFARTAWTAAKPTADHPAGSFNVVSHRRSLTDPSSRTITAPNNDCLLSTARIDLSTGPLVLSVPDIADRYFSTVFIDAFTDTFFLIGTRATGGKGGRFLITPPEWRGRVSDGLTRIHAPTTDVWMLVRILVDGPGDYPRLHALQDRFELTGLPCAAPGTRLPVPPGDVLDPANFLAVVNAMLARVPASDPRVRRAARYASVGLRRGEPGAFASLDAGQQARWRAAIPAVLQTLPTAGKGRRREAHGWSYSLLTTGNYGADDLQRAQVALIGLAALPPTEAFYAHALADADGAAFDGAHRYRLHMPRGGPPVDAFWSLTMYRIEPDGRLFLSANAIDRYSIGDRTLACSSIRTDRSTCCCSTSARRVRWRRTGCLLPLGRSVPPCALIWRNATFSICAGSCPRSSGSADIAARRGVYRVTPSTSRNVASDQPVFSPRKAATISRSACRTIVSRCDATT